MTSDFYFTATSWFPGKCPRKTPFKAQWGGASSNAEPSILTKRGGAIAPPAPPPSLTPLLLIDVTMKCKWTLKVDFEKIEYVLTFSSNFNTLTYLYKMGTQRFLWIIFKLIWFDYTIVTHSNQAWMKVSFQNFESANVQNGYESICNIKNHNS